MSKSLKIVDGKLFLSDDVDNSKKELKTVSDIVESIYKSSSTSDSFKKMIRNIFRMNSDYEGRLIKCLSNVTLGTTLEGDDMFFCERVSNGTGSITYYSVTDSNIYYLVIRHWKLKFDESCSAFTLYPQIEGEEVGADNNSIAEYIISHTMIENFRNQTVLINSLDEKFSTFDWEGDERYDCHALYNLLNNYIPKEVIIELE